MTEIQTAEAPEAADVGQAPAPTTSDYGREILRGVELKSLRILPEHKRLAKEDTSPVEGVDEQGVTGPIVVFRDPQHGLTVYVGARRVLTAIELGVKTADVALQRTSESGREYVDVHPSLLLIGANVREDTQLTGGYLRQVKANGVDDPVDARLDLETGAPVVFRGQRRTLAAVQKGLELIPVLVWPPQKGTQQQQEVDEICAQVRENLDRASMRTRELATSALRLMDLKVPAARVAKRLNLPVAAVQAAVKARGNAEAESAMDGGLDLVELGIALDLEERLPGARDRLIAAKPQGRFGDLAAELAIEAERTAARDAVIARLQAQKVTVVEEAYCTVGMRAVADLKGPNGGTMTVEEHATCSGHAAWVRPLEGLVAKYHDDEEAKGFRPEEEWVCTDTDGKGHRLRWESDPGPKGHSAERKAASAAARNWNPKMETRNKARLDWLCNTFVKEVTEKLPKGWEKWLARVQVASFPAQEAGAKSWHRQVVKALGLQMPSSFHGRVHPLVEDLESISIQRTLARLVLMNVFAHEELFDRCSWRTRRPELVAYLLQLEKWGYKLEPVERLLAYGEAGESATEGLADEALADEALADDGMADEEPDGAATDRHAEELLEQLVEAADVD